MLNTLDFGSSRFVTNAPVPDKPADSKAPDGKPEPITKPDREAVKDSPFLLSTREWLSIQRYVTNAMSLPTDMAKMRVALQMPADMKFEKFQELLKGYQTIVPHVTQWKTTVYPSTVELAADIAHYGSTAEVRFNALLKFVAQLEKNPNDSHAKVALDAMVKQLWEDASRKSENAKKVCDDIAKFSQQTETDAQLIGTLVEKYKREFDDNSAWGKDLIKSLKDINADLEKATKDYEYDKAVACSTVAYAWIPIPPGIIASAVVAGIYGDRAVHDRDRIERLKKQLKDANSNQVFSIQLSCSYNLANNNLRQIQHDIELALPVVQKIQGIWAAISGDLEKLRKLIATDIDEAIVEIKEVGIENAIISWKELKLKADAYRANAYIVVTSEK